MKAPTKRVVYAALSLAQTRLAPGTENDPSHDTSLKLGEELLDEAIGAYLLLRPGGALLREMLSMSIYDVLDDPPDWDAGERLWGSYTPRDLRDAVESLSLDFAAFVADIAASPSVDEQRARLVELAS